MLTESVRDAADLFMSLKYPPVVFISDSPCGFVRHMECRDPELCKELWGENSGCFEKPEYAKKPTAVCCFQHCLMCTCWYSFFVPSLFPKKRCLIYIFSINLLVFFDEWHSLIGFAINYLFFDRNLFNIYILLTLNVSFFQQVECPQIVPAEYRAVSALKVPEELEQTEHPISEFSRRFVLGDRFHSSTDPHKSPLCLFHNIDLCAQGNAIKTSYQESENFRKNMRRLRSSTLQGFGTHFCYNYLMDFYQNEAIVKQQITKISKHLKEGQQIVRDRYHRFCVINVVKSAS